MRVEWNRRQFLVGAATAAMAKANAQGEHAGNQLPVLGPNYPRAYFFRSSEIFAANPKITYEQWEKSFERLMGIEGKVLDEELPGRSQRNIAFFTKFKQRHRDQVVLLHFNGTGRDPRYQTERFAAGDWLYFNGAQILSDVPAQDGESEIRVSDASLFRTGIGRFKKCNEDIGLCALDAQGKPNWAESEQVQLITVDAAGKLIRVRRGQYGSRPHAFRAGQSYAAAHVFEGPWGGENSHLLWYYNYALAAPPHADGQRCLDILVEDLARRFDPQGELAGFDGLEFDVLYHTVIPNDAGGRGVDVDNDGKADAGIVEGVNSYGAGVVEFCRKLRARMGDGKIIQADGMMARNQRAFGILNGIESEGFAINDFSGGVNRHLFWNANARPPVFNYINYSVGKLDPKTGRQVIPDVPFSRNRLVMAAAQLTDVAFCYSYPPKPEEGELVGIWDELRMGAENRLGWLGKASGPMVRIAETQPDVLAGSGAHRIQSPGALVEKVGSGVRISAKTAAAQLSFRITIPLAGPDLLLKLTARGEPMSGYPPEVARLVWANTPAPNAARIMTWMNAKDFESGFYFSNLLLQTLDINFSVEGSEPVFVSDIVAYAHPDVMYREFDNGVVMANPTPREYPFDLRKLFPGKSFRRLKASPLQDTVVNNGAPVAGTTTLQPYDALFLVRESRKV